MTFKLHPRLAAGTHPIGIRADCHILLKNNACFPWLLIVPEVSDQIEDLHQLDADRYEEVMAVVRNVSRFTSDYFNSEKLNVACIGNIVRQMHIHIVGRSEADPAWPGTVWASDTKRSYQENEVTTIVTAAREHLKLA